MAHGRTGVPDRVLTVLIAGAIICMAGTAAASAGTTVEQIGETLSAAGASIAGALPEGTAALSLDVSASEHADLVRVAMTSALSANGVRVVDGTEWDCVPTLRVELDRLDVTVADTRRHRLVGSRDVLRRVETSLDYRLTGRSSEILATDSAEAQSAEWVSESAIRNEAASRRLEVPPDVLVTIAEVVVVTGSVVVVVYLFFTQ